MGTRAKLYGMTDYFRNGTGIWLLLDMGSKRIGRFQRCNIERERERERERETERVCVCVSERGHKYTLLSSR